MPEQPTDCATCAGRDLALDLLMWGEILLCREHGSVMQSVLESQGADT